jgi:hypothetical protein
MWSFAMAAVFLSLCYRGKIRRSRMEAGVIGMHNVQNALAVYALARHLGVERARLVEGFATFAGVKRRQEVRGERRGVLVIDDFAHHPTAVRATIEAVRAAYRGRRLWAIFEPRSNTSKRDISCDRIRPRFGSGRPRGRRRGLSTGESTGGGKALGGEGRRCNQPASGGGAGAFHRKSCLRSRPTSAREADCRRCHCGHVQRRLRRLAEPDPGGFISLDRAARIPGCKNIFPPCCHRFCFRHIALTLRVQNHFLDLLGVPGAEVRGFDPRLRQMSPERGPEHVKQC